MNLNQFIKTMLAGIAFPAVFLPLAYTALYCYEQNVLQTHPFQFIPMYIPLLFGLTNTLYFLSRDHCPIKNRNCCLWVFGIALGIIVATIAVYVLHAPELLFGFSGGIEYLPIILLPLIYGLIFRYIINWLNCELGI